MNEINSNKKDPLKILLYIIGAFGVALTITTELSHHYPWIMELCGGSKSGCADVASTPFAKMFGVSVAYWGLLSYVLFLFLLVYAPVYTLPLAAALMGAETYFLWVMSSVIHIFCTFCIIQFITVSVLFVLTLAWNLKRDHQGIPGGIWSAPFIVILVFATLVVPVKIKSQNIQIADSEIITYWGNPDSDIKIEIFSDYQCGYCKKLEPVIDEIMKKHPDILIIFRDYVIRGHDVSPFAVSYANAIAFTKGREEFIKIRREIFDNQRRIREYLKEKAAAIKFSDDLKRKIRIKVSKDMERAASLDIYQTPSIVISRNGNVTQTIKGYKAYDKIAPFLKR